MANPLELGIMSVEYKQKEVTAIAPYAKRWSMVAGAQSSVIACRSRVSEGRWSLVVGRWSLVIGHSSFVVPVTHCTRLHGPRRWPAT